MSTDLTLPPLEIIRLYGLRFKIEVSFKQALRTIGGYAYHFWMQAMTPIKQSSGNQYLSSAFPRLVWSHFGSWIRTIRPGICPSELVTTIAMRNTFPEFLADSSHMPTFKKFLYNRIDYERIEGTRMIA